MKSMWIFAGSIFGFFSVAMGAFGAHSLSESLSPKALSVYQTAAQYQMYHSLALVGLGIWMALNPAIAGSSLAHFVGWAFALGIVLFSGSLYALAITDVKILGAITPLGGLFFLAGWIALAFLAWKVS